MTTLKNMNYLPSPNRSPTSSLMSIRGKKSSTGSSVLLLLNSIFTKMEGSLFVYRCHEVGSEELSPVPSWTAEQSKYV